MTKWLFTFAAGLVVFIFMLQARVVRLEVLTRADVLEGKPFGESGSYEKITGKIHLGVKPDDSHKK